MYKAPTALYHHTIALEIVVYFAVDGRLQVAIAVE